MTHTLDSLTALDEICRRCRSLTRLVGATICGDGLSVIVRTELENPQTLSARFYRAGWNIVQIDNLGGDVFRFEMVKA